MAKQPSQKQVEANRRNAARSTGPRTPEGKARSSRNGLRHGLAAEVLVPEEDRATYEKELARWTRDAGPDNAVEAHLVRRAAVGSVTLDRIERAREETREQSAREAVAQWEKRQRARARRKAQDLPKDPANVLLDLEETAFGCDWLIRRWRALAAPLLVGGAWDPRMLATAQLLLGLPEGMPCEDADRAVRRLWILAAAASPARVKALARVAGEAALPTDPAAARNGLRRFVAEQVDRLSRLREASWEEVEGPERRAVALRAAAADTSKDGQLRHRYETAADRSCNAAVRLYLNIRDRRRRELLAIAKEAGRIGIPRAPVGGGWWREADSDPAPPGFSRLDPIAADPAPAPPPPEVAPPAPEPDFPRRTEPISPANPTDDARRNPNPHNPLRNDHPDRHPDADRRTEPTHPPHRSPRPGPNPAD